MSNKIAVMLDGGHVRVHAKAGTALPEGCVNR